ncbi:MAG TPA: ice-binding family protein [Gallionella sp.]|nr:ice-binding family protein [Gallionella sp.]
MNKFNSSKKPLVWFSALLLTAAVAGCGGQDPILGGGAGAGVTTTTGPAGVTAANILKSASTFGIAATAGITNTNTLPLTTINGDVVLDPTLTCNGTAVPGATAGSGSAGFGQCNSTTPTSVPILNGTVYITGDTPTAGVVADLKSAFLQITPPAGPPAAGSLGGATNLPAGTTLGAVSGSAMVVGDNLFYPGVYQSKTSIMITGDLTLDAQGNPDAVFVFQSSSSVGTAAGGPTPANRTRILLINGAKASNVWWQAGTSATLGLYSEFQGNILASADITMKTGATSCGRLLAGAFTSGAFVFDSNVVSVPGQPFAPPAGYSTTCQ